jgi:N-formylglutamate deformylase
MPSQSVAGLAPIPDIVLGTGFGHACRPAFLELTERTFVDAGFSVAVNTPFAGGYTTHHYGAPDAHVECIQIEIRRDLYMDEKTIKPNHHYTQFKNLFAHTLKALITHSKYI